VAHESLKNAARAAMLSFAAIACAACGDRGPLVVTSPVDTSIANASNILETAPSSKAHSQRFELSIDLPDGQGWKVDDHSRPEFVAIHLPTRSSVVIERWPETDLMNRAKCEERARERGLVPKGNFTSVDDAAIEFPKGFDTRVHSQRRDRPSREHGRSMSAASTSAVFVDPQTSTRADSSRGIDTDVTIETPEHIVFRHRVAGPGRRVLAYIVDLVICYGAVFIVAILIGLATFGARAFDVEEAADGMGTGLILLLLFVVQWIYFVLWEGARGTTPGKMALGLRVVTTVGRPIGFAEAALRNVLRAADSLPIAYAVGVISMSVTSRFQRIGDLVAGTMVIIPDHARVASPIVLYPPAQPSELADIPDDITLDAEERTALELFLRRRHALGPAREYELAAIVIETLVKRFPGLRVQDPPRTLALLYDQAVNRGRSEGPMSSRRASSIPPPPGRSQ
jgi:uncharacterized RDD family membrane protein YckC